MQRNVHITLTGGRPSSFHHHSTYIFYGFCGGKGANCAKEFSCGDTPKRTLLMNEWKLDKQRAYVHLGALFRVFLFSAQNWDRRLPLHRGFRSSLSLQCVVQSFCVSFQLAEGKDMYYSLSLSAVFKCFFFFNAPSIQGQRTQKAAAGGRLCSLTLLVGKRVGIGERGRKCEELWREMGREGNKTMAAAFLLGDAAPNDTARPLGAEMQRSDYDLFSIYTISLNFDSLVSRACPEATGSNRVLRARSR